MTIQTGYAEINGARVYYECAGEGASVTLLHAGIADRRMWDGQFEALAQHYRVVRYDLRGYGQTTSRPSAYSHVEDLHALLNFLDIRSTALIGCSMGGTTALDFTLTYPQMVTALVLVAATPGGYEMRGAPPPLISQLIEAQQSRDPERMAQLAVLIWGVGEKRAPEQVNEKVRALIHEMSKIGFQNQLAGLGEPGSLTPPAVNRLKEVHIPTLILDGGEDSPAVHEAGKLMEAQIVGARRAVIAGAAHLPSLELPQEFNRIVSDFLNVSLKR